MSTILPVNVSISYRVCFSTNIRGHHVYKSIWKPEKGVRLDCRKDDRAEASEYDKHAIGVYKQMDSTLVGHVPIECSALMDNFLSADEANRLSAAVTGKRKREVGLVVPAKFTCITKTRRLANILYQELVKKKEKYSEHYCLQ